MKFIFSLSREVLDSLINNPHLGGADRTFGTIFLLPAFCVDIILLPVSAIIEVISYFNGKVIR